MGDSTQDAQVEVRGDALRLRFVGEKDGEPVHELRAAHVAEVLQGVVGLAADFAKAGALADGPGTELFVRPPQEGSFVLDVIRDFGDFDFGSFATGLGVTGAPSLCTVLWWATRSVRAEVQDFTYLENGNVKLNWQDNTVSEVPEAVWRELQVRKHRRKKQLRQIMAPLSEHGVTALEISDTEAADESSQDDAPATFTLERPDYQAMLGDEVDEEVEIVFDAEAQMGAVDFDSGEKWRIKTAESERSATVVDKEFLREVDNGLALHKNDIFWLRIREVGTVKNGRLSRKWTVLKVLEHRRGSGDDDA
jgi:hypothetical protein